MGLEKYMGIIDHEHHVSPRHPKMSIMERAAQFAPFAALTGYDSVIAETGRETNERLELDEMQVLRLDEAMRDILEALPERPRVRLTRFVPDSRKSGGSYVAVEGNVRNVDFSAGTLILTDDRAIPLRDICDLVLDQGLDQGV